MGTLGVNILSNPIHNPAMSDCYIQACRILAGVCSGICMVSRVRVMVKVTVRDRCGVPLAELLDLSAVDNRVGTHSGRVHCLP